MLLYYTSCIMKSCWMKGISSISWNVWLGQVESASQWSYWWKWVGEKRGRGDFTSRDQWASVECHGKRSGYPIHCFQVPVTKKRGLPKTIKGGWNRNLNNSYLPESCVWWSRRLGTQARWPTIALPVAACLRTSFGVSRGYNFCFGEEFGSLNYSPPYYFKRKW